MATQVHTLVVLPQNKGPLGGSNFQYNCWGMLCNS